MKGDVIVLEKYHVEAGETVASLILSKIVSLQTRFVITVSGESGSGKSETAKAIGDALRSKGINSVILGQDDYFVLPPKSNDEKRRADDTWLGPHAEVHMDLLNSHILSARNNEDQITKPLVDYTNNSITNESVSLIDVRVLIVEGTYTALLRNVDCKVFIDRNRLDTYEHRAKRNRGNEVNDPFIEEVLKTEHKIIAGHRYLADILISKDYQVSVCP